MIGPLSVFQMVQLVVGLLSLTIITLTYLRMRRMRPDQLEAQLSRRLSGPFQLRGTRVIVREVRVTPAVSVAGRLQNLVRRYPLGWVNIEVRVAGPDVTHGRPWDSETFGRLCRAENVSPEAYEKPEDPVHGDETIVELRFRNTDPRDVTQFVRRLPEAAVGDLTPVAEAA